MHWTRGHAIGSGSSATVSIATSRSGDIFAVKSTELSQSEFLQREQKILSNLSSPRVVSYKGYDVTSENNKLTYNLMMEYVPGGTLIDAIRQRGGRLEESMIRNYTRQIVEGLEYLHSSGIVHCDIKGRNILIGQTGAKIADLGCAKRINSVGRANHGDVAVVPIGGTPVFMAPEVARGDDQGFPADIWALGCTITEMATGGSPWHNVKHPMSVLYRIAFSGELPEFPDFLSNQAKDFLGKCLRRDPKERWTSKQLLKHPFLEEFNSQTKQIQEFDSPTSILDQDIWNSEEEPECTLVDVVHASSLDSPAQRMARLWWLNSGVEPKWAREESWITIRSNKVEHDDNAKAVCGPVTASIVHDMELERTVSGKEELRNLLDSNSVRCNILDCTWEQHNNVVICSLNFE